MNDRDIEIEIERLKTATSSLQARADFEQRVMAAIASEASAPAGAHVLEQLNSPARRTLPWLAAMAAVVLGWATQVQPPSDDEFAVDYAQVSSLDVAYSAVVDEGQEEASW